MERDPDLVLYTKAPSETQDISEIIGENLPEKTVITLYGDLGSGKTTFVQGLARGLRVPEDFYVTSPTYSIINEYPGRVPFFHMDLYRIYDLDELYEIGFDEIIDGDGVIAIEWPERLPDDFFKSYLKISIETLEMEERKISFFTYGLNLPDLIQKLTNLNFSRKPRLA